MRADGRRTYARHPPIGESRGKGERRRWPRKGGRCEISAFRKSTQNTRYAHSAHRPSSSHLTQCPSYISVRSLSPLSLYTAARSLLNSHQCCHGYSPLPSHSLCRHTLHSCTGRGSQARPGLLLHTPQDTQTRGRPHSHKTHNTHDGKSKHGECAPCPHLITPKTTKHPCLTHDLSLRSSISLSLYYSPRPVGRQSFCRLLAPSSVCHECGCGGGGDNPCCPAIAALCFRMRAS